MSYNSECLTCGGPPLHSARFLTSNAARGTGRDLDTVQILRSAFKSGLLVFLGGSIAAATLLAVSARFFMVATEGADMPLGILDHRITEATWLVAPVFFQMKFPCLDIERVRLPAQNNHRATLDRFRLRISRGKFGYFAQDQLTNALPTRLCSLIGGKGTHFPVRTEQMHSHMTGFVSGPRLIVIVGHCRHQKPLSKAKHLSPGICCKHPVPEVLMQALSCFEILSLVRSSCGDEGCDKLLSSFGGMRMHIPKNVGGRLLEPLGAGLLAVLVRYYGDTAIDVPSRGHAERIMRSVRLKHDVVHSDLSANEIAAKHGVTHVWVRRLRRDLLEKPQSKLTKAKA